ncbi:FAS1 domain [Quillaja saponaria]|uniref:FAS1 domain n=1 Tax=Quillaja saponaria TaxID=32244 RepID=A0AAD7LE26_QUISA|nr:FAS1 domain [Quillaja saponaria]
MMAYFPPNNSCKFVLLIPLVLLGSFEFLSSTDPPLDIRPQASKVQVDKITKALWDSGFKIMSLVLEMKLPHIISNCSNTQKQISFNNKNNKGITIFVAPDEAFGRNRMWAKEFRTDYHVVPWKLGKEDFFSGKLSVHNYMLPTCNLYHNLSVHLVGSNKTMVFINYVYIHSWDIYNDGYVAIHAAQLFLDINWNL